MIVSRTVQIQGTNPVEYALIVAHLESIRAAFPGWHIEYEPLSNRATATRSDDIETL